MKCSVNTNKIEIVSSFCRVEDYTCRRTGQISVFWVYFNECVEKRKQIIFSRYREYNVSLVQEH